MTQEYLQLLPSSLFDLTADGDNDKFFRPFAEQMSEVDSVFEDIRNARDIQLQSGEVLNLIGEMVWEKRDGKLDDDYRIYLTIAIQKMLCSGAEPNIASVFRSLLGDVFIGVRDLYPGCPDMPGVDLYLDGSWYLDGTYYAGEGSVRKPAFFDVAISSLTSDSLKNLCAKIITHLKGAGIACKITVLEV